ncbi:MAG TPA: hypothetical protein VJN02_10645 [Gammaproteobacteria bacterium]|nr:hypothetical protein [Gammaproteobacteria bacterium]
MKRVLLFLGLCILGSSLYSYPNPRSSRKDASNPQEQFPPTDLSETGESNL